ncbi:hypothetical protein PS631_00218 [Pseudomonas fluorescens]|uniref:Uncharacterized protein n=1 Tax=Pseudomonas fluorescens TaxID=294 RepID=A0A5E6PF19_PSEFL|nr:hypothetical protein [Pseudomonas fluorescens]VVM39767.1 hypothetical protein PS631_00218 [Pseudomonas fluorescens]
MSYFKSTQESLQLREYMTEEGLCFECGKKIEGGAVRYDGYGEPRIIKGLFFHPACAALVGQRLICDGFPNRHKN